MAKASARPSGNSLLDALPQQVQRDVIGASETVQLVFGEPVCQPGERIRHVYFPTSGYISLITPEGASESLEVGLVGTEGAFGITLMLGVMTSPLLGLVQGNGTAWRISTTRFKRALDATDAFRNMMGRYLYVLMAQIAQTAACNRFHVIDARLARWLLMTHDRVAGNTFHLTHTFLAEMLGVRRAGVTTAAGRLNKRGLIQYQRGALTILNRPGLEAASCACYQACNAVYVEHLALRAVVKAGAS